MSLRLRFGRRWRVAPFGGRDEHTDLDAGRSDRSGFQRGGIVAQRILANGRGHFGRSLRRAVARRNGEAFVVRNIPGAPEIRARRTQSEDRRRSADRSAPRVGVPPFACAEGANQRAGNRRLARRGLSEWPYWVRRRSRRKRFVPSAKLPPSSTCLSTCCVFGRPSSPRS